MLRYIHGSADSTDLDVMYIFDSIPTRADATRFCSDNSIENKNVAVVKDGVVVWVYKGTVDEVNNALYYTIPLHENPPSIITELLPRDILLKTIRVMRGILSHCSRTVHRPKVKAALTSYSWKDRVSVLESLPLHQIEDFGKQDIVEVYKFLAFQFGQVFGLLDGVELYTKASVAETYPQLKPYLYRQPMPFGVLHDFYHRFIEYTRSLKVVEKHDCVEFVDFDKTVDLKRECFFK